MLRISGDIQRRAAPLLDLQMWCWGWDVRRPAGNLLMAYGAAKRPAPDARYHSAYSFQVDQDAVLNLWGWGIWLARPGQGSVFISRTRFRAFYSPVATLMPQAWRACDLPAMPGTHDEQQAHDGSALLAAALNWIGGYEHWLRGQIEADYRPGVVEQWPQLRKYKHAVPATSISEAWLELSINVMKEPAR